MIIGIGSANYSHRYRSQPIPLTIGPIMSITALLLYPGLGLALPEYSGLLTGLHRTHPLSPSVAPPGECSEALALLFNSPGGDAVIVVVRIVTKSEPLIFEVLASLT